MIRTRTKVRNLGRGEAYENNWGQLYSDIIDNQVDVSDTCIDDVSPGNGGPLTINKYSTSFEPMSRRKDLSDRVQMWCSNYMPLATQANGSYCQHIAMPSRPTDSSLASRLLKGTNPSRPVVDLPVFIAELRDLPDLVRREGGTLIKKVAKYNLKYQFGLAPLLSDVSSMLDFSSMVDKRFAELNALSQGGISRTRQLWSNSTSKKDDYVVVYNAPIGRPRAFSVSTVTSTRIWGHVRWRPTGSFPRTSSEQLALARRAVLGLTLDASTAWELMPWSWLVDWFSNIGDILAAARNIVPCQPSTPLIMETTETEAIFKAIGGGEVPDFDQDFFKKLTTKSRRIASADSPSAQLPILSGRQLSILGSLYVTRSGRYNTPKTS